MDKYLSVRSKSGIVHAIKTTEANFHVGALYAMLCGAGVESRTTRILSDVPVTCKRCLKKLEGKKDG